MSRYRRLITLMLLLGFCGTITIPSLPAVHAMPAVYEPSDQPSAIIQTPPPLPTPRSARSTGYSVGEAEAATAAAEQNHTLGDQFFDGTFSGPARETKLFNSGPYSVVSSKDSVISVDMPGHVVGGAHDSITLDVRVKNATWTPPDPPEPWTDAVRAVIEIKPITGTTWFSSELFDGGGYTQTVTPIETVHLTLNQAFFPPDVPIQVRFRCGSFWDTRDGWCEFSNLRFNDEGAGWEFIPHVYNPVYAIYTRYAMGVVREPSGGIVPEDGGFFVWEKLAYSGPNEGLLHRGPRVQMPHFEPTDIITGTVRWAEEDFPNPGTDRVAAQIRFIDESQPDWFAVLASTQGSSDPPHIGWKTSTPVIHTGNWAEWLSDRRGTIKLFVNPYLSPKQRTAIDSFQLYRNGELIEIPLIDDPQARAVPDDQALGECVCLEDGSYVGQPQGYHGEPVNTHSGAFYFKTTDMVVPTQGPPLRIDRAYISTYADTTRYHTTWMGPGWHYTAGHILVLPTQIGGEPGRIIYEHPNGNRLRFDDTGNGTYRAWPGIRASLSFSAATQTYTLMNRDHDVLIFDDQGRILEHRDAQGRTQRSIYGDDPTKPSYGQRLQVYDVTSERSLWFEYIPFGDGESRLSAVRNDLGDTVSYTYTDHGELETVTDVNGGVTTYSYEPSEFGTAYYLTRIQRPGDTPTAPYLTNVYHEGRVTEQTDALGLTITFTYTATPDGGLITTITQQKPGAVADVTKHHYRPDGSLRVSERNGYFTGYTAFGSNFAMSATIDGNLNPLTITTNAAGLPTSAIDASNQATLTQYDSKQNVTSLEEPTGLQSTFTYDSNNNLTRSVRESADGLRLTTHLTYTTQSRLTEHQHSNGDITAYTYYPNGDVETATTDAGTSAALTTRYLYDALGRQTDSILGDGTPLATRTHIVYRPDNQIETVVENFSGDGTFNPMFPEQNLITRYGYDIKGQHIWTQDPTGAYQHYARHDALGRVLWMVRNPVPLPTASSSAPVYDPQNPDQNIVTLYAYDGLGQVTLITETGILTGSFNRITESFTQTTTRTTQIQYDGLGRPVTTTLNYRPEYAGPQRSDVNVHLYTYYDGVGNVTWRSDTLGRWTHIEYDAVNRPVTTTVNYENGNPRTVDPANTVWTDGTDTDLIAVTVYDAHGQPTKTIQNYDDGIFTASEPLTDRITLVDVTTAGHVITSTVNYDPDTVGTRTDTNQVRLIRFEPTKNQLRAMRDPLGRWSTVEYDSAGRLQTQIAHCTNTAGTPVAQGCAPLDPINNPDRNVPTTMIYDALGRVVETRVANQVSTRTVYDSLGRVVTQTDNYIPNAPSSADVNVSHHMQYDRLGQRIATIDPLGRTTTYAYNKLGAQVTITDPTGATTRMGYDGQGTQRWTRAADGTYTVTFLDGLGRPIKVIRNYEDGIVTAADGADRDVVITMEVDLAGRRIAVVDPLGRVTITRYTLRDAVATVTENAVSSLQCEEVITNDCNLLTQYRYDRAGNQIAFIDANGHRQRITTYDAMGLPISESDELGHERTWSYDAAGRIIHHTTGTATLIYAYNARDQLTQANTINSEQSYTNRYDVLGRMTQAKTVQTTPASTVVVDYEYDALNRITHTAQHIQPSWGVATTSYEYDQAGQLRALTYPNNKVIQYTYTPRGELDTVVENLSVLADYAYDPIGFVQNVSLGNGLHMVQTRNGLGALTRRDYQRNGSTVLAESYELNRRNERLSRTEQRESTSTLETYAYDHVGRLKQAILGITTRTYGYDKVGNRTQTTINGQTTSHTYNAANQITDAGWQYDAAGNLRADGGKTYTYDGFGQLTTIIKDSTTTTNLYGPDGTLVRQDATNSLGTQRMDYAVDWASSLSRILQVTTMGQTTTTERSVYGLEQLFTTPDASKTIRTWLLNDGLGSVVATTNTSGSVAAQQTYDPWGQTLGASASLFGFTGELTDRPWDLIYLRARWYNPAEGTFLSRDPFKGYHTTPASLHPYTYAFNNPVSYTDPNGQDVCDPIHGYPHACYPQTGTQPQDPPPPPQPRSGRQAPERPSLAEVACSMIRKIPTDWLKQDRRMYDFGYIEGISTSGSAGIPPLASISALGGFETVYDVYDLHIGDFVYTGSAINLSTMGSEKGSDILEANVGLYVGGVTGWSRYPAYPLGLGVLNYEGDTYAFSGNISGQIVKLISKLSSASPLGFSISGFRSADSQLRGVTLGITLGIGLGTVPYKGIPVGVSVDITTTYKQTAPARVFDQTPSGGRQFATQVWISNVSGLTNPVYTLGRTFTSVLALDSTQ